MLTARFCLDLAVPRSAPRLKRKAMDKMPLKGAMAGGPAYEVLVLYIYILEYTRTY